MLSWLLLWLACWTLLLVLNKVWRKAKEKRKVETVDLEDTFFLVMAIMAAATLAKAAVMGVAANQGRAWQRHVETQNRIQEAVQENMTLLITLKISPTRTTGPLV